MGGGGRGMPPIKNGDTPMPPPPPEEKSSFFVQSAKMFGKNLSPPSWVVPPPMEGTALPIKSRQRENPGQSQSQNRTIFLSAPPPLAPFRMEPEAPLPLLQNSLQAPPPNFGEPLQNLVTPPPIETNVSLGDFY